MTNNPEAYNLEELLAGYVLGNLSESELAWLNQQLAVNPHLKEQVRQLEETLTLMPYGLPQDLPNSDLRSQILAKAKPKSSISNWSRLSWIVSAITILSTLWLGVSSYRLRHQLALANSQLQQQQELISLLRQPNNRLVALKGLDGLPTASGSLFIAPEKQKAVLALQNLQPLEGEQVYRLWAVFQEEKTGCASFSVDEKGTVHLELSNDALSRAQSILITIEPKPDTLQPVGNPIMTGYYSL